MTHLRRLLSNRVRAHLRRLPQEQLLLAGSDGNNTGETSSIEELLLGNNSLDGNDDSNHLLQASQEDIEQCYSMAERVGNKWSEVLQRQGYCELAEIAFEIVNRGRFLENDSVSNTSSSITDNNEQAKTSKYASPYTALHHGLRRYPPDCNGSGLPSKYLPAALDCSVREQVSAREAIQQIDSIVKNENEEMTNCYWQHGWDAIEEAVERNKKRIDYSRMKYNSSNAGYGGEDYEIVPKQDYEALLLKRIDDVDDVDGGEEGEEGRVAELNENNEDEEGGRVKNSLQQRSKKRNRSSLPERKKKAVQFKSDDNDDDGGYTNTASREDGKIHGGRVADIDFLISTNQKAASILKRRRRGQEEDVIASGSAKRSMDHYDGSSDEVEQCNEIAKEELNIHNVGRGRPASSIGQEKMSWDEMLRSMSREERQRIIVSAIHPPYPFESEMKTQDDDDEAMDNGDSKSAEDQQQHSAVICGALKEIGSIHLWEQTRHFPAATSSCDEGEEEEDSATRKQHISEGVGIKEIIYGASGARASDQSQQLVKLQKRATARATKERLGKRTLSIAEHKAEYSKMVKCSKVRWTEDDDRVHCGKEILESGSMSLTDSSSPPLLGKCEQSDQQQERKWLEMDLGECMIELVDDKEQTEQGEGRSEKGEKSKRFLAFRSLELALTH
eukprot:CAMPEP_0172316944 /NCGR_PEP_ID=MMETSP1058-20130122/30087_1 /TAXON_ID=83371 /ORGANISM="Detonula confervacea, Strain CCMP 353" /LENGTH=671 /DNA_ID=CAMNT_0013031383 /DNA_START=228 /DNA_END=2243 /DNA_ORIENTATION=-